MKMFTLLLLCALAIECYGTDCYVCTSTENPACGDKFEPTIGTGVGCVLIYGEPESGGCNKRKVKQKIAGTWTSTVTRNCSAEYSNTNCGPYQKLIENGANGDKTFIYECSCHDDYCNTAMPNSSVSVTLLTAFVALACYTWR